MTTSDWYLEQGVIPESLISNSDRASKHIGAAEVRPGNKISTTLVLNVVGQMPTRKNRNAVASHLGSGITFHWDDPVDTFPMRLTMTIDGDLYASDYFAANGDPNTHQGEVIDYLSYNSIQVERHYNIPFEVWMGGKMTVFTLSFTAYFERKSLRVRDQESREDFYNFLTRLLDMIDRIWKTLDQQWIWVLVCIALIFILLKVLNVIP